MFFGHPQIDAVVDVEGLEEERELSPQNQRDQNPGPHFGLMIPEDRHLVEDGQLLHPGNPAADLQGVHHEAAQDDGETGIGRVTVPGTQDSRSGLPSDEPPASAPSSPNSRGRRWRSLGRCRWARSARCGNRGRIPLVIDHGGPLPELVARMPPPGVLNPLLQRNLRNDDLVLLDPNFVDAVDGPHPLEVPDLVLIFGKPDHLENHEQIGTLDLLHLQEAQDVGPDLLEIGPLRYFSYVSGVVPSKAMMRLSSPDSRSSWLRRRSNRVALVETTV